MIKIMSFTEMALKSFFMLKILFYEIKMFQMGKIESMNYLCLYLDTWTHFPGVYNG